MFRAGRLGLLLRHALSGVGQRAPPVQRVLVVRQPGSHHVADEPGTDPVHGFARLDVVPEPAERAGHKSELVGMALIILCLGVTAASFYEIYEWVVDNWFGQHRFIGETDTITDLADGFLGAGIGGLFLAAWAVGRWGSRRAVRPI
jgi:hypothetical protein